jgi:hypothetical protein
MKIGLTILFYVAALVFLYAGVNFPGAEGLNHHVMPRNDAEIMSALLVINGMAAKLMGHVMLFSAARS